MNQGLAPHHRGTKREMCYDVLRRTRVRNDDLVTWLLSSFSYLRRYSTSSDHDLRVTSVRLIVSIVSRNIGVSSYAIAAVPVSGCYIAPELVDRGHSQMNGDHNHELCDCFSPMRCRMSSRMMSGKKHPFEHRAKP